MPTDDPPKLFLVRLYDNDTYQARYESRNQAKLDELRDQVRVQQSRYALSWIEIDTDSTQKGPWLKNHVWTLGTEREKPPSKPEEPLG